MPTIVVLDIGLSMQRMVPGRSEENALTFMQLSSKGIIQLLDYLSTLNSKMEYVSLLTYGDIVETKVDFTRDYDLIKQALKKIDTAYTSKPAQMLKTCVSLFESNWGQTQNGTIVIFTSCCIGFGKDSLVKIKENYGKEKFLKEYAWIEKLKQYDLNFICVGLRTDVSFQGCLVVYEETFQACKFSKAKIYAPKPLKDLNENNSNSSHQHKNLLGRTVMYEMVEKCCEENFKQFEAILKCGGYFRLECAINLWPSPQPYISKEDSDSLPRHIAHKLEICGFLALSDIGSPASLSRHLIYPKVEREKPNSRNSDKNNTNNNNNDNASNNNNNNNDNNNINNNNNNNSNNGNNKDNNSKDNNSNSNKSTLDVHRPNYEYEKLEQDIRDFYARETSENDNESGDDGDQSKTTNNNNNSSTANVPESQRESLCVLLHAALKMESLAGVVLLGENWYGFVYAFADSKKKSNLMLNILPPGNNVIPWLGDMSMLGLAEDLIPGESNSTFPVKAEKRSYAQSCVVWIRHVSLQSDVQKVLRHAKKMPEKTQNFFKELNRIRRAALSIGFVELLDAMATLFEKEISVSSSNQEYNLQLQHAANELRKPTNRDLKISIMPLPKLTTINATTTTAAATTDVKISATNSSTEFYKNS